MRETYLYHGIYFCCDEHIYYDHEKTMRILEDVCKSGSLLSRRKQGIDNCKDINFAGLDYISFCDRKLRFAKPYEGKRILRKYTAYDSYISNSLALGFDRKKIDVIDTNLVQPMFLEYKKEEKLSEYGLSIDIRYSDMADEVQVRDEVSLGNLKCLTLPVHLMNSRYAGVIYDCGDICRCIDDINNLMSDYGYVVPVYDLYSKELLNSEEQVQKVLKKYRIG